MWSVQLKKIHSTQSVNRLVDHVNKQLGIQLVKQPFKSKVNKSKSYLLKLFDRTNNESAGGFNVMADQWVFISKKEWLKLIQCNI